MGNIFFVKLVNQVLLGVGSVNLYVKIFDL
jgi:hypothetical protein